MSNIAGGSSSSITPGAQQTVGSNALAAGALRRTYGVPLAGMPRAMLDRLNFSICVMHSDKKVRDWKLLNCTTVGISRVLR